MESLSKRISRRLPVAWILPVLAILCSAPSQAAKGQTFTVKDLGTLPGGTSSNATDINKHGEIVGESTTANGATHAFLYQNGFMIDLGTIPGDASSQAAAINDAGQIVGTSFTANLSPHAFLFDNGV